MRLPEAMRRKMLFGFAVLSSCFLIVDAWEIRFSPRCVNPMPIAKSTTPVAAIAMMAALLASSTISVPPALAAADIAKGQELFELNCAGCHAGGQNLVKPAKSLQSLALTKYLGGTDPSTIQSFAMKNHPKVVFFKMPDGKLTTEQYQDVTAYISDQATNEKW
jgi:cytochrome c6